MTTHLKIPKFSIGVGDRFAHQAKAQLQVCILANAKGLAIAPVWNKSNREHTIIGSEPTATRQAADKAVKELVWPLPYFLDADHINLKTVDRFLGACDFYTIDVADSIGKPADEALVQAFTHRHPELIGTVNIPGLDAPLHTTADFVASVVRKYLAAVIEAGEIYRYIEQKKGAGTFITEVSMDETDSPQTPIELLIILAAIADEKIPIQTIAPKFTGRFNKGVDYVGDLAQFRMEFESDLAAIAYGIHEYGLPDTLKLSVHSGSDKYSIYKPMREALRKFNAGVHVKTAGTTWLEEVIGLAEAGGEALALAKEIYAQAYDHRDELCAPYATVIDIDQDGLPSPSTVDSWASEQFTGALRHLPGDGPETALYNPNFRQLLHVGFKIAAKMGNRYLHMLEANEEIVARNVTENLYQRHIYPIFLQN